MFIYKPVTLWNSVGDTRCYYDMLKYYLWTNIELVENVCVISSFV